MNHLIDNELDSNVPKSNCFAYLLQYGGQYVAHHMGLRFCFFIPCAPPQSAASKRGCATRPGGAHTPRPTAGLEQCSPKPPLACG
jgi:hypothetical protein